MFKSLEQLLLLPSCRQVQAAAEREGGVAVRGAGEGEPRGVLHADVQGKPHRHHVRQVLAKRQVRVT